MVERTYYMDNLQGIKNEKDGEHDTVPIIIPTLCRYEHFARCIESLKENKYAQYTDIYIGIDYPITEEQRDDNRRNTVQTAIGSQHFLASGYMWMYT